MREGGALRPPHGGPSPFRLAAMVETGFAGAAATRQGRLLVSYGFSAIPEKRVRVFQYAGNKVEE
jgi:hypothetical protein